MKTAWLLLLALLVPDPAGAPPVARGFVKLHVLPPHGQSVPRELAVRVRSTLLLKGNEDHPWEVEVSCPVRDGECVCEVPAGQVDLRFQGAAVMPVYKWGAFVVRGEIEDLGPLELRRGAAITGWVRTSQEKVLSHAVLVSLVPQRVGSGMVGLDPKALRTLTLEANSRPWGFFRFDDVLPGSYAVTVKDAGKPEASFGPIVIHGDRSFELPEPIWITPPLQLDVQVTPPRDPSGKPWEVVVVPDAGARSWRTWPEERQSRSDMDGHWTFGNLPPADYVVGVRDANRVRWKQGKVRVGPHSTSLKLEVPFVKVQGVVTGPVSPLTGELRFRSEGAEVPLKCDEQGRFEGYIPDEGAWTVHLRLAGLKHSLNLQEPVRAPKGRGLIDLVVRIPDTRLQVEVVDEQGRSVPRTWLNVLGPIRNQDMVDEFGRYEIVGLNPGPQCLLAAHADPPRNGEETPVILQEGLSRPPVRLVLPDKVDVRCRIRPRLGFAAGAQVLYWATSSGNPVKGISATADEDGDLRIAADAPKLSFMVLPPGSALRMLQAEVSRDRLLEIPVDTPGGTLVLDLGDQTPADAGLLDREEPSKKRTPCTPGKTSLSQMQILRHWADLQGTPQTPGFLVVPNVEPGPYTLCATNPPVLRRREPRAENPLCVGGVLEAAGELRLKLPRVPIGRPEIVNPSR